jgi:hypothetical protein
MPSALPTTDASTMWTVTTTGDLPDDHETRGYEAPLAAWSDYHGRILELEIGGYMRAGEEPPSTGGAGSAP